jgi:hypothetical protein
LLWKDKPMTYAIPGPPAKQRPAPVRIAVLLLWAVVILNVVSVGLGFVPTPELDRAMDDFNRANPELATDDSLTTISAVIGAVVLGIVTIALAILAVFVGRGSQPARITTWVLSGILVLCQGCGLIATAAAPALVNSMAGSGNADSEVLAEQTRIITENTPAWLTAATTVIGVLSVIALIAVIILLAVPAANEFFRKQDEIWVPPTTPGTPGGFPQYPPPAMPPGPPPSQPPAPPTQPPYPPTQP